MQENMFPKKLDNAEVLHYTPKDNYGYIYYDNGDIADCINYLAICQYSNDKDQYYLFRCDENYEVVGDSLWDSIEECMGVANSSYGGNIIWIDVATL